MNVVRAPWTNASFLLYAGGLIILFATVFLLATLDNDYGEAAFVGWSLLVLAVLAGCAFALRRADHSVAAGLFAVSSVLAFGVFVGALEDWFGWLPSNKGAFEGFDVSALFLELLIVVAALVALGLFRFPLLTLVAAIVGWFFVTDLLSGGGDWSATVTIAFGIALMLAAMSLDAGPSRPYGLWPHVVAGLTIGGGLLWFWHSDSGDWVLIGIAGLVYIAVSDRLMRSSWAVLGAVGLLLFTIYFSEKWARGGNFSFVNGNGSATRHDWARPVSYSILGLVLMGLGLFLSWRRRALAAPEAT